MFASDGQKMRGTLDDRSVVTDKWDKLKVVGGSERLVEPKTCIVGLPHNEKICAMGCGELRKRTPVRRAVSTCLGYGCKMLVSISCRIHANENTYVNILEHAEYEEIQLRIAPSYDYPGDC
jgi:hypothetical protein